MNNYGFLPKSALSYLLNNLEEFDDFTINQVREYCKNQDWNIEKIKRKNPVWENQIGERLNYEEEEHKIVISVKENAKKATLNGHIFVAVVLLLLLFSTLYSVLNHDFESKHELIMATVGIPFTFLLLIGVLKKIQSIKISLKSKTVYQILETAELLIIDDGNISSLGEIKSINLF